MAISLVIAGHFWADEHLWSGVSKLGVEFFFVLSGRLMAEILFIRKVPLPTFFIRRFSRVYPGLVAFVALVTIVSMRSAYAHGGVAVALALTFTLNYAMVYAHPVALLDHLWSLCVEEHGYAVLAGVALVTRRFIRPAGIAIAALGVAALANGLVRTYALHEGFFQVNWRTDVAAAAILLPAALWLRLHAASIPRWIAPLALGVAVCCRIEPAYAISFGIATPALALAVTTIDRSPRLLLAILSHRALRLTGLWSYSLYLWQQPFYKLHLAGVAPTPVLILGAVACAAISFYAVERPARRAINRFAGRRAGQASIAV